MNIREKLEKLGIDITKCKKCQADIFFITTKNGKQMPVNMMLDSHFSDCKFADSFRKKGTK